MSYLQHHWPDNVVRTCLPMWLTFYALPLLEDGAYACHLVVHPSAEV